MDTEVEAESSNEPIKPKVEENPKNKEEDKAEVEEESEFQPADIRSALEKEVVIQLERDRFKRKDSLAELELPEDFVMINHTPEVHSPKTEAELKAHKEQYATLRDWEINRHKILVELKQLFDNICESVFAALTSAIKNNRNLVKWFETLLNGLKEFSKQVASTPALTLPTTYVEAPDVQLLSLVPKINKSFSKNIIELTKYLESTIMSELKGVMVSYNRTVNAQKEIYPSYSKAIKDTEKKLMKLFNGFTMSAKSKEKQILDCGIKERTDMWMPFHQYEVILKNQFNYISKYAEYCRELIKIRGNLETVRVNSCIKSLKDYASKYSSCFGGLGGFNFVLPEVDIGKVAEEIIMLETNEVDTSTPLKYTLTQLGELEEMMKGKISSFRPLPEISLIQYKTNCKRLGGLFNSLINSIVIHTIDQYLHVLDNEDNEIPVFSLDLKKTQAMNNNTSIELLEKKNTITIMEKLNIRSSHKIILDSKEVAEEWATRINSINQ